VLEAALKINMEKICNVIIAWIILGFTILLFPKPKQHVDIGLKQNKYEIGTYFNNSQT